MRKSSTFLRPSQILPPCCARQRIVGIQRHQDQMKILTVGSRSHMLTYMENYHPVIIYPMTDKHICDAQ
jgi:hypothetical protein